MPYEVEGRRRTPKLTCVAAIKGIESSRLEHGTSFLHMRKRKRRRKKRKNKIKKTRLGKWS